MQGITFPGPDGAPIQSSPGQSDNQGTPKRVSGLPPVRRPSSWIMIQAKV